MRITEALGALEDLNIDEFRRRSQLDRASQNRLLKVLAEDVSMSMGEASRRARVPYGSVRGSFAYLGLAAGESERGAQAVLRRVRVELIRKELERTPWATGRTIAKRLDMPYHVVQPLMKAEGLKGERIPRHGTAVEYGHWKCRCRVCVDANRERCYAVKADMRSRPEDIPHGTQTAYWNWACRCEECRVVGSRVNKGRVFTEPEARGRVGVRWTPEEDAVVAGDESARSIALRLGRSVSSVNTRRATLKRQAA